MHYRKIQNHFKSSTHFRRLTLSDIFEQKIRAPFIPELDGPGDTANFDDYDESPLLVKDHDEFADKFADFPWQC